MNGLRMLGLLSAVAAAIALVQGWPELSTWLRDRQELAVWVQAIGSIAAIAATGWAVQRAHNLQERQRQDEASSDYTRLLEAVYQLVAGTAGAAAKLIDVVGKQYQNVSSLTLELLHSEVSVIRSSLDPIDVTRLNRLEFVRGVLAAKTMAFRLSYELELALRAAKGEGHTDGNSIIKSADAASQLLGLHLKYMAPIISVRGGVPRDDSYLFL